MQKQIIDYQWILMDASVFVKPFPEEIGQQLSRAQVCITSSFETETAQYGLLLDDTRRKIYDANLTLIRRCQPHRVVSKIKDTNIHCDMWNTILQICNGKAYDKDAYLLITANRLLIQRLILNEIPMDIYDLQADSWYDFSRYAQAKPACEFRGDSEYEAVLPIPEDAVQKENKSRLPRKLQLYCSDGTKVELTVKSELEGAEARIYGVKERPSQLAKIFIPKGRKPEKIHNVKHLLEKGKRIDVPWTMFPEELLYWDAACENVAGFLQHYAQATKSLGEEVLYIGYMDDVECKAKREITKVSDTVERCLAMVRQVAFLNVFGLYISDYNLANFAVPKTADRDFTKPLEITMWDVDSFCSREYRPSSWDNTVQPDSLSAANKAERLNANAMLNCTELLFICVYRMLTLGERVYYCDPPNSDKSEFQRPNRKFQMTGSLSSDQQKKKVMVPTNVWKLFETVFGKGKAEALSVELLLRELSIAYNLLLQFPETDLTYEQIWNGQRPKRTVIIDDQVEKEVLRRYEQRKQLRTVHGEVLAHLPELLKVKTPRMLRSSPADPELDIPVAPVHYQRLQTRPQMYLTDSQNRRKERRKLRKKQRQILSCLLALLFLVVLLLVLHKEGYIVRFIEMGALAIRGLKAAIFDIINWFKQSLI